jgi:hypothetical protein
MMLQTLIYRGFLEGHDAEDLHDFVGCLMESMAMLQQVNQHVHDYRDPELGLDGVGCCAEERLDVQVLLHPLEQQFDLPSLAIQQRDRQRVQRQVIGQERQSLPLSLPTSSDSLQVAQRIAPQQFILKGTRHGSH